jgi:hypothetical protein
LFPRLIKSRKKGSINFEANVRKKAFQKLGGLRCHYKTSYDYLAIIHKLKLRCRKFYKVKNAPLPPVDDRKILSRKTAT